MSAGSRPPNAGIHPVFHPVFALFSYAFCGSHEAKLSLGLFTIYVIRMSDLPHFDDAGRSRMVDVGEKAETHRVARARGTLAMLANTQTLIRDRMIQKGDVLELARVAGIMASKKNVGDDPIVPSPATGLCRDKL